MTHVAFPFRFGPLGRTENADDTAYIRSLIEQVLFTHPGERVMRPGFGGGAKALVFEPAGEALARAAEINIHAGLNQALSDLVQATGVSVEADEERLAVTVRFAVRGETMPRTEVFVRKRP